MDASPVKAGQVLAGKYRIERVLGEGGMGVVVEAHDISLERRVAIKFLLPDFVKHPEATQRFMREARAAAKIQSEHVARVIDVSTLETGAPYMVMEFLEGLDLSQVIDTSGALPVEDVALYVIQACEALAEAHANGIIHRDLKPANLFLAQQAGGSRKIKVLDFGISKTLSATDPGLLGSLTRTSSMMGSPLYMSPEQMKSSRDVDLRTDIWALGVIIYEALTANTPFTGGSIPEISAKILLSDPRPLGEFKPDVPQALVDVTTRALHKQPDMRFQNVGELAVALLPYAPNRARGNVERIIRVLNAAGMANSEFLASIAPLENALYGNGVDVLRIKDVSASASQLRNASKPKQGTVANFGNTQTERAPSARKRGGSRRVIVAAAVSVLSIAGALALILRSNTAPPVKASIEQPVARGASAPLPGVQVTSEPAAPLAPSIKPVPMPEAPAPIPNLPGDDAAPSEGAASDAVKAPAEAATAVPTAGVAAPTGKPVASRTAANVGAKKATRPKPAPQPARKAGVAKAPEKSYSGDFTSKFGSRK